MWKAATTSFQLSEAELLQRVEASREGVEVKIERPPTSNSWVGREAELLKMLPESGWFREYAEYTASNESPLSFHLFSSLCVLGSALGRRAKKPMGFFDIYPNYCVILIGPTGRVKKTSAADIAKEFIRQATLCPIMADKITPESLVTALQESGHHFIYAPEFSVFFNKQRYNEGLTTLMLRLLDCPKEWAARTQARQVETLTDIALTVLGCSTMSLLTNSAPQEVTSGGFLNRFVLVVEADTERCYPEPSKGAAALEASLMATLKRLKTWAGDFDLTPEAKDWYDNWYVTRRTELRATADERIVEIRERGSMHLLRTGMLTHAAHHDDLHICKKCLQFASNLINFSERSLPAVASALNKTPFSQDIDYVVETIRRLGGAADHSTLLRRVSSRMNTRQLKLHIQTLAESGRVKVTKSAMALYYILKEEESRGS